MFTWRCHCRKQPELCIFCFSLFSLLQFVQRYSSGTMDSSSIVKCNTYHSCVAEPRLGILMVTVSERCNIFIISLLNPMILRGLVLLLFLFGWWVRDAQVQVQFCRMFPLISDAIIFMHTNMHARWNDEMFDFDWWRISAVHNNKLSSRLK